MINERTEKITNDRDSMTVSERTEETPMHKEGSDTNESDDYDQFFDVKTDRIKVDDKGKRKRGVGRSEHRKKVKGSQLYDPLAGLELYETEDETRKQDKTKGAIRSREKTVEKVDVGTDSRDRRKAVQTKLVKCRQGKKDERKKCQRWKEIGWKLARPTESKERRWKKCIEEYKKRKR